MDSGVALIKFINAEKEMDEYRVSLSLASTSRAVKWHSGWWAVGGSQLFKVDCLIVD